MDEIASLKAQIEYLENQLAEKTHQLQQYQRNPPTPPPSIISETIPFPVQNGDPLPHICLHCKRQIKPTPGTKRAQGSKRAYDNRDEPGPKPKRVRGEIFLESIATHKPVSSDGRRRIIAAIAGQLVETRPTLPEVNCGELVVLGMVFAHFINSSEANLNNDKRVVFFQDLIFTSFCAVLDHWTLASKHAIDDLLKIRAGDSGSKNLKRRRNGATWANGIISDSAVGECDSNEGRVEKVGLATEAFFQNGSVAIFGDAAEVNDSDNVKDEAIAIIKRVWLQRSSIPTTEFPFVIPVFVHITFPEISLRKICPALGYSENDAAIFRPLVQKYRGACQSPYPNAGDKNRDGTLVVHAGRQACDELQMNNARRQQSHTRPDLANEAGETDTGNQTMAIQEDARGVNTFVDCIETDAPCSPQPSGPTPEVSEKPQLYEDGFDALQVPPTMYSEGFEALFLLEN